jgi:hypothetical protein
LLTRSSENKKQDGKNSDKMRPARRPLKREELLLREEGHEGAHGRGDHYNDDEYGYHGCIDKRVAGDG